MQYPEIIIAVVAIATAAAGVTVFYKGSAGKDTINLLQTNIAAYKDSEKLKDTRIAYLEGQLVIKDETIKRILGNDKRRRNKEG